jgi:WD40 repeat protein
VLPLGGNVVQAWFDEGTSSWQLLTDVGEICDVGDASNEARTPPMAQAKVQASCVTLGDLGQVKLAVGFGKRALAVTAGDSVWLGRHLGTKWVLERLTGVGAADSLSFSADGERLAVAEKAKGSVSVFSTSAAERLTTLSHAALFFWDPSSAETLADRPSRPEAFPVSEMAWSPDGRTLATLQETQGVRLWAMAPGASAEPRRLKGHVGAHWLKWSLDGTRLLSAGNDGDLWSWPVSGGLRQRHAVLNQRVYAAALRLQDQLLAVVGENNNLLLLAGC